VAKKMPKEIFVKREKDGDGSEWLNASMDQLSLVDDEETTEIATYTLAKVNRLEKVVKFVNLPPRRRGFRG